MYMKRIVLPALIILLAGCSTSGPVTANPDRSTTTDGTAGSAKMTDGALKEGMTTTKSTAVPDSTQKGRDSLPAGKNR